jgi:hypothetical protein
VRSLQHAVDIELFLHQQGLDTTTPAGGKAMFAMMVGSVRFVRTIRSALSTRRAGAWSDAGCTVPLVTVARL